MIKPQKCIICKKDFWFKKQGIKPQAGVRIRSKNCVTCSKECAKKKYHFKNKMKIKPKLQNFISNDDNWNLLKLYFILPFMFVGFWVWGFKEGYYPIMDYIWIGFEILLPGIVGFATYYHRDKFRGWNPFKWK